MIANSIIGLIFIQYLLDFGQIEILKAWNVRDITQKELINILENLEESIITRNKNGFGFCNEHGNKILRLIQKSNIDKSLINSQSYTNLNKKP